MAEVIPVTYPSQSDVLKFLEFGKRKELAKLCPEIRTRHRKLPFQFEKLKIRKSDDRYSFSFNQVFISFEVREKPNFVKLVKSGVKKTIRKQSIEDILKTCVNYYSNRKGTKVKEMTIDRFPAILSYPLPLEIQKLSVFCDEAPESFSMISEGSKRLEELKIWGSSFYNLIKSEYILQSETVIIGHPGLDVQLSAKEKLSKTKRLVFQFQHLLPNYHGLSEEIMQYSLLSRPVGTILDFVVHDSFNFQNYPYFGKIQKELNARLTELKDRTCLTYPMKNAELNVFIIPNSELRFIYDEITWILRMEVMKKGTAKDRIEKKQKPIANY